MLTAMCPMDGVEGLLRNMVPMSICMAVPIPAISGQDGDIMPDPPVADPEVVAAAVLAHVPVPVQAVAVPDAARRIPTQHIRKLLNKLNSIYQI